MNEFMIRLKKHYLPLLAMVIIAGIIFYIYRGRRDTITYVAWITGYSSLIILTSSLIIGPINLLLKRKNPVSTYFRRDISITGGTLAVIHSITGLFVHMRGKNWQYFLIKTDHGYSIRLDNFGLANYTGLFSALIIITLIITSNDYILKKLNPARWKNIQRLSYLMFILAMVHCYFYIIGRDNFSILYWLFLPLLIIVLILQMTGALVTLRRE